MFFRVSILILLMTQPAFATGWTIPFEVGEEIPANWGEGINLSLSSYFNLLFISLFTSLGVFLFFGWLSNRWLKSGCYTALTFVLVWLGAIGFIFDGYTHDYPTHAHVKKLSVECRLKNGTPLAAWADPAYGPSVRCKLDDKPKQTPKPSAQPSTKEK